MNCYKHPQKTSLSYNESTDKENQLHEVPIAKLPPAQDAMRAPRAAEDAPQPGWKENNGVKRPCQKQGQAPAAQKERTNSSAQLLCEEDRPDKAYAARHAFDCRPKARELLRRIGFIGCRTLHQQHHKAKQSDDRSIEFSVDSMVEEQATLRQGNAPSVLTLQIVRVSSRLTLYLGNIFRFTDRRLCLEQLSMPRAMNIELWEEKMPTAALAAFSAIYCTYKVAVVWITVPTRENKYESNAAPI